MARINGSGFKMSKSPLAKNIFKGREGYDPAAKRAKLKGDVQGFVGGLKKGAQAVDKKLQHVGKFLSSKSIKDRKSKASVKTTPGNATKNKPTDREITVETKNNLTLGGNKNKNIKAPEAPRIRRDAADKSLAPKGQGWLTSGNYALNKKTYLATKVSVKKPKTTDLSKTTGVKAPKKVKATVKQQGVLEKQVQKTNKNKPKTKATVKNQGVLEKAITKPKKATVKNKVTTSKKATTTTTKKSKSGKRSGESSYQYAIRTRKETNQKKKALSKSISNSQAKNKPTNSKVDLTRKKGLGPRA